ncbi:DEAD/DEAH box helicase [Catenovulum sp. SM1970]|uniref:DEAD/DEAH box helicase n=1 Tax=Marinifaba aquimaris TaxID=2741323 RepID=UPI001574526F|nr:DEAD/DEAH box helicase [Marinifaba aquimaris]NTS78746.1 DEAD/DEAH box helicase [Marinifaba aquimaris]
MSFSELSLHTLLNKTLDHLGFKEATEIQQKAIPVALTGRDLIASSKTGSGKTLAYLLPTLHRLLKTKSFSRRDPRAVVLAPTRELANQVYAQLRSLVANTNFTATKLIGGDNFNDQAKALRKDPHIIVATAGRLADHLDKRHLCLNGLEVLIFDEADRMLDLGFAEQLRVIHQAADHRKRQTLLFSATLDGEEVKMLSQELLNNPLRVAVGAANEEHKDITQRFYLADHLDHKKAILAKLLELETCRQVIVFTATRADTQTIADELIEQGIKAVALSGDLSQAKRNQIMESFAKEEYQLLVTTDVASRGLDLRNVSHVFNFDQPKHAEEYVHRIGRTGRAGFKGTAISLVGPRDWVSFKQVEAFLQQQISFDQVEGLEAKFKGLKPKKANKPSKPRANKDKQGNRPVRKKTTKRPSGKPGSIKPVMDGDLPPVKRKTRVDFDTE